MRKIESATLHPSDYRLAEAEFARLFDDVQTRHGRCDDAGTSETSRQACDIAGGLTL